MRTDKYKIEKEVERFKKIGYTGFINRNISLEIINILKKASLKYEIYEVIEDADKVIIYNKKPEVTCFEIECYNKLKHSDIMGSIYNFQVNENVIGDILVDNSKYYFYILSSMEDYFLENFKMVGNYSITIKKIDLPYYERKYMDIEFVSSSTRIDSVISRLINIKRNDIDNLISKKNIILNYNVLTNKSYQLKDGDIFSIRGFGKFKYVGIIKKTKKDNLVLKVLKYI